MRMLQYSVLLCLLAGAGAHAHGAPAGNPNAPPKLAYSNAKTVEDLDVAPMIAERLDCGDDGSIYTLMDGYALSSERPALLAIHPDGTVTSFSWRSAPEFTHIMAPQSILSCGDRRNNYRMTSSISIGREQWFGIMRKALQLDQ
jgi:hypothetical protein